jgi:flagellar hook-length control protein FliK
VLAVNADSSFEATLAPPQIQPENLNTNQTSQTKSVGASGANRAAIEREQTFAQSQQRGVSGSVQGVPQSGTVTAPVPTSSQTNVTPVQGQAEGLPGLELLSSSEALPPIVPGSEIQLSDLQSSPLSSQTQQPSVVESSLALATAPLLNPGLDAMKPAVVSDAAMHTATLTQSGSTPQVQPQVAAQVVLASIPTQNVVQEASGPVSEPISEPLPQGPVSETSSAPQTISPLQRFLNDNTMRNGTVVNSSSVQVPVTLTRSSVQELAQSVTRQYNLRQNVFQQVLSAIEDAGQGQNQIRIQLKPESLGTLDVSLSMEGGKLTARLVAANSDVRDVLASNLTQFKQALEAQGLQVNQLSVAVRADMNSQGQTQQQWQQNQSLWQQAMQGEAPEPTSPWASFSAPGNSPQSTSTFSALA